MYVDTTYSDRAVVDIMLTTSRPDSPFVVFYGNSPDSPPAELTGTVVLTNSGPVDVKTITIQLQGVQKVSYNAAADVCRYRSLPSYLSHMDKQQC